MKGFTGFMLSYIFGIKILGTVEIGDIFIFIDESKNPFTDKINYKKVIDIKDGFVKYASYSEISKEFCYEHSSDIRGFLTFNVKTDRFKG